MLPEPVLLLGGSGQVGSALRRILGKNVIAPDSSEADFSRPEKLSSALAHYEPKIIINAAAATSVDAIESEESKAHLINADSVKVLAALAKTKNIPFIHYSTDYVFDGEGTTPWSEDDQTSPLNAYGRTKLAGEKAIQEIGGKYIILRTSWVYSEGEKNFVNTMLRLGKEREVLSIVDDQIGSPTYATDIAEATVKIVSAAMDMNHFPSGIYNLCNSGFTSWFEFAENIFEKALAEGIDLKIMEVKPIKTREYKTAAKRPLNSRLDTTKLTSTFGVTIPEWRDALDRCIKNIGRKNAGN